MKIRLSPEGERGLTLVEFLVVIAVLAVLAAMLLPARTRDHVSSLRIRCINNLKDTGLAFRVWEGDNGDKFSWEAGQTNESTIDFSSGPNLWRHFQIASNELSTPKVLVCPADESRVVATNFAFLNNSNISYFLGLDAVETDPQAILSGDRNITNGTPVENGILKLMPNHAAGWTAEIHKKVGNILLADGSVQQVSSANLEMVSANEVVVTNRLLMPILSP